MEDNNWYEGIERGISSLKEKMPKEDYSDYELDLLLRVAKRVAGFSSDCEHCHGHRNDISKLITNLDNISLTNEEEADYGRTFRIITNHLKKYHRLHRSLPNPVPPLVAAPLLFIISMALLGNGMGTGSDTSFVSGLVVLLVAVCTFLAGVILGILRRFIKPI